MNSYERVRAILPIRCFKQLDLVHFQLTCSHGCREIEVNERMQELVPDIRGSDQLAAGLLIECRGQSAEALQVHAPIKYFSGQICCRMVLLLVCRDGCARCD